MINVVSHPTRRRVQGDCHPSLIIRNTTRFLRITSKIFTNIYAIVHNFFDFIHIGVNLCWILSNFFEYFEIICTQLFWNRAEWKHFLQKLWKYLYFVQFNTNFSEYNGIKSLWYFIEQFQVIRILNKPNGKCHCFKLLAPNLTLGTCRYTSW